MTPPSAEAPAASIVAGPRIDDDRVIGSVPILLATGMAAMWIPKRESLLGGARLSVPAPHGAEVDDPVLRQRARDELAAITGARWPASASVTVHDHLEDAQTRAEYRAKGLTIGWDTDGWYDPPETRYVAWSGTVDSLHVEVTGAIGEWAVLLVAQPLAATEALDGSFPRRRPVDALALVRRVAPGFAAHPWQEDAPAPPANVFDVSLHADGARIRAPGGAGARRLISTERA